MKSTKKIICSFSLIINLFLCTERALTTESDDLKQLNVTVIPGKDCYRSCSVGDSKICYFKFVMEHYHAMGAACKKCGQGEMKDCFNTHCLAMDGFERGVLSINRQIPGPSISVCENDWIVVDVVNEMMGTSTALHWHGVHVKNSPWMDGVPFVTQCPINYASTFRYAYQATESGTQFYHSHAGHHKINGHYGPMIIRKPLETELHNNLYDFDLKEHTFMITDWNHHDAEMFSPGLPTKLPGINPENLLINGRGIYRTVNLSQNEKSTNTPIEVYKVRRNKAYRFRAINAACYYCAIEIKVQDHNMKVIATDSYDLQPMETDSLSITSGERFDFVISATQPAGIYCMKVTYLGKCACPSCQQYALLVYVDDKEEHAVSVDEYINYQKEVNACFKTNITTTLKLNDPTTICYDADSKEKCAGELSSMEKLDVELLNGPVDHKFYLGINVDHPLLEDVFAEDKYEFFINTYNTTMEQMSLNNISLTYPSVSALTQTEALSDEMFCDADHLPENCEPNRLCYCIHRLKVKLNSTVEIVLVDETGEKEENHPFHIHGHKFYVMSMGQLLDEQITVQKIKELEVAQKLQTLAPNQVPVLKDTISIQYRGYAVIRFRADNPGFWLFHCHYENHVLAGMGVILQVGEFSDFKAPPKDFPKCGSYTPEIQEIVKNKL